ncbi:hypothetical protein [Pantoea vagans]|uniref:hypothetical protein n=1 Tax=Pantoea vagans TaxID=470934 RepID=UPI0023AF147E|nr:hypothetical protein [Pantoea vagans]MDE8557613.1 hypothetical protein [Pantoea vagans]MDE8577181.1 hypothetical protein [Pantoea vagans]
MKRMFLLTLLTLPLTAVNAATNMIICKPASKNDSSATGIWPVPYLSQNKLCFNMKNQSGSTCVKNGMTTIWFTEAVIVTIDGESLGRDDTWFKVARPIVNDKEIDYTIEASRDKKEWITMSKVSINRISGQAVDWFIREHGGTSYNCHLEGKKL